MPRLSYLVFLGLFAAACSESGESDFGDGEIPGEGAEGGAEGDGYADSGAESDDASDPTEGGDSGDSDTGAGDEPSAGGEGQIEPGTLTAGVWDDNLNFDVFTAYRDAFLGQSPQGAPAFETAEHTSAQEQDAPGPKQRLDIALVIDTTGSMGDEISYLQTEFDALSAAIAAEYPAAEQRWSLVLYRDETDEYVVRWFDFRDDLDEFRAELADQEASGGGDYPEAADQGLEIANQLSWRGSADVAKLVFWVADAPHHAEDSDALADAIRDAQGQDLHIYPVASSGVDDVTEFSMHAAAQLTGGRYIFLTDDSGVGNPHAEPTIPCYFVTKLDSAILRMVDVEMSGAYQEPDSSDVLRVGGDLQDGACILPDGNTVAAF